MVGRLYERRHDDVMKTLRRRNEMLRRRYEDVMKKLCGCCDNESHVPGNLVSKYGFNTCGGGLATRPAEVVLKRVLKSYIFPPFGL